MIDQEEQENIEQVENTEANTQEEENVSLQQPQDQTQDVVEEESAPEATSSAPEATSSAPQLTPLQYVINNLFVFIILLFCRQYDIEHREYLNKKRQESEALLQQTCEQATSYLENFHEDYEKKKQLAKEKNRLVLSIKVFFFLIKLNSYIYIYFILFNQGRRKIIFRK